MKVLLASDGSEQAEMATRFLLRFPHVEQLEIAVLSCYSVPTFYLNEASGDWIGEFRDLADTQATHIRNQTEKLFSGSKLKFEFVRQEGQSGDEIVEYAKKNGFDLVVLGATGHSMLSRILLGSVSDFVATHAHCSVLIVRSKEHTEQKQWIPNVTIAYDGSPHSKAAIDEFSRFNWGAKIEVHLVHAEHNLYAYRERLKPALQSRDSLEKENMLDQLRRVARQLPFADPAPKFHLFETDHIGQSIVDFASRANSDVILLGDTGVSAIDRMMLGSVSHFVLRHAPMSVWIARSKVAQQLHIS